MIKLSTSARWRYITFGAMNLSQGLLCGLAFTRYFFLFTDLKLSPEQVGADRFGARRLMTIASVGMAVTMSVLGLCPDIWQSTVYMFSWYGVHFVVQYVFGAALLALFMSLSNPAIVAIGATHISIYFALNNLCFTFCDWAGRKLLATQDYGNTFIVCAAIQPLVLTPLIWCDPRRVREQFLFPAKRVYI